LVHDLVSLELETEATVLSNIGLYSYGTALLAYCILALLAFIARRNNPLGQALLIASALTALWATIVTVSTLLAEPQTVLIQLSEVARNAAWIFVLLKLIGVRLAGTDHILASSRWIPWFAISFCAILITLRGAEYLADMMPSMYYLSVNASFSIWVAMSVVGLLLLEQYFRNSAEGELWATKHLCVGLGILFAFDFFMYSEALLFRQLDRSSWQARGIVTAMAAILMAISISRTVRDKSENTVQGIHLSRHVAFHSLTLMASGIYLITMALAAYFIRYLGGSWGGVLQITFLCAAGLTLIVLLFSGRIRASARVWLSKNFFSYKYDYRLEWLQFTETLASGQNDIPENITRAVANLVKSPAGILWSRSENDRFSIVANWEMPLPTSEIDLDDLSVWLQEEGWIIDLREWQRSPDLYRNLKLPMGLSAISRAWLIIPLLFGERLQGILLLRESDLPQDFNWEDRDLLKVAGKQAGSHLAQFQADRALVESRQFEAFNRLSAYVIHDLKNILAQLSLMVSNAQKHKHNPEFIDDMVSTVSNTVTRMSKLMAQLRSGAGQKEQEEFDLGELLKEVVDEARLRAPVPNLVLAESTLKLNCDRDRLQTVFGHLVQNAQEATSKDGVITVRTLCERGTAIVEVEDSGTGMDEEFVRNRLFKPFDSTKGLTGMGIGAFESRDFIHSLGGRIQVQSTLGSGSIFRVTIPCAERAMDKLENTPQKVTVS
jgi:putative PEP-CTERM system histidine kinase